MEVPGRMARPVGRFPGAAGWQAVQVRRIRVAGKVAGSIARRMLRPIGIRPAARVASRASVVSINRCRACVLAEGTAEPLRGAVATLGARPVAGYPQGSNGNVGESRSVQMSYPQKPLDNRSVNVRIHSGRIEDICEVPDRRQKLFHTAQNCARVLRTVMHRLSP